MLLCYQAGKSVEFFFKSQMDMKTHRPSQTTVTVKYGINNFPWLGPTTDYDTFFSRLQSKNQTGLILLWEDIIRR